VAGDQGETVLQLLDDLDGWTQRYSGDVSQHQALLDSLSNAVSDDNHQSLSSDHVVALLQKVMQSNNDLKQKLSTAESQLDQKSQQIKWYLNEARTDALTGLANRRAFDQRLEELFAEHRRGGRSFVIALVDIDHFKSVNDLHGHAEGDRVLKDFAHLLRREVADGLLVARFGGEEFAIILAGPLRQSADHMDHLRQKIAAQTLVAGHAGLQLTISVGLSEPGDDMGAASIVRRADEALYAAKHIGRNRVYYHDGREPSLVDAPEVVS
jgi:diguanylate cyclase